MDDGRIGTRKLRSGTACCIWPTSMELGLKAPAPGAVSVSLMLPVTDTDAALGRAREHGAAVEREIYENTDRAMRPSSIRSATAGRSRVRRIPAVRRPEAPRTQRFRAGRAVVCHLRGAGFGRVPRLLRPGAGWTFAPGRVSDGGRCRMPTRCPERRAAAARLPCRCGRLLTSTRRSRGSARPVGPSSTSPPASRTAAAQCADDQGARFYLGPEFLGRAARLSTRAEGRRRSGAAAILPRAFMTLPGIPPPTTPTTAPSRS